MLAKQKEVEELDFAIMHEVDLDYENATGATDKKKEIVKAVDSDDELLEMMQNNEDEDYLAGILDDE